MSSLSDYLENKLIDQMFRGVAYTWPTTLYFALVTAASSDAAIGTEVTGGSYSRPSLACNSTNFANTQNSGTTASSGTSGTTSNLTAIAWSTAPSANWGLVIGVAIMDASSGGNMMAYAALAASKNINNGDPAPSFAIGALTFQFDN